METLTTDEIAEIEAAYNTLYAQQKVGSERTSDVLSAARAAIEQEMSDIGYLFGCRGETRFHLSTRD